MDEAFLAKPEDWRQQTLQQTLAQLRQKERIFAFWDEGPNHYWYETEADAPVSLPEEAGVYVFYSKKTDRAAYVGETASLRKRLRLHCRVSGKSVFKRRWVPRWIGKQATVEDLVRFVHSRMVLNYVVVPFGRLEIEADLRALWGLPGPESVSPSEF
jgi:hypothetical protein